MDDILNAVKTCFNKYADFSGRAARPEFWWFFLFQIVVLFVASIIGGDILYGHSKRLEDSDAPAGRASGHLSVHYVAEFRARKDAAALNETLSTMFYVFSAIGAVVYLLAIGVSFLLPYIFNLDPAQARAAPARAWRRQA